MLSFLPILTLLPLALSSPSSIPETHSLTTRAQQCGSATTNTGFNEQLLASGHCENVQFSFEPYKKIFNYHCGLCVVHEWRDCTGRITYSGGPIRVGDKGVEIPWSYSYWCF